MIRSLAPRVSSAGSYLVAWDGRMFNGAMAPAGFYRVVGRGESIRISGRVLLLH
jgi:hypothetical protein